jgi:hypothetical protein
MPDSILLGFGAGGMPKTLSPRERSTHLHVLGASGRGKSKCLENLIREDIKAGHGLCLIDPHGSLYQAVVSWCAYEGLQSRRKIHLVDPNETEWLTGFDPLRTPVAGDLSMTVDATVSACAQVWGGEDSNKTPLLKKCLRAVFYALAAHGRPFSDAIRLVTIRDRAQFAQALTTNLDDPIFQAIWDDFNALQNRDFADVFSSTVNRLVEFLGSPTVRAILGQKDKALDLSACMDEGHIVLVNLQPTNMSLDNAALIGTLLTNGLFGAAIRRDEARARMRPFYLYIDECYRFMTSDIESMLDQTRKFGLHLILAHQHLDQLAKYGDHILNAVMTNAQTKVIFGGLSEKDASIMAHEVLRETFDFSRSKAILEKPVVTGYVTTEFRSTSRSRSRSVSEGTSDSQGTTEATGTSETVSRAFDDMGLPLPGYGVATGETRNLSTGKTAGRSRGSTVSDGETEGTSEGLFPIFETLPGAVEGSEEILNRAILQVKKLAVGNFICARPDRSPEILSAPTINEPMVSPRRRRDFLSDARERSVFTVRRADIATVAEVIDDDSDDFGVPNQP